MSTTLRTAIDTLTDYAASARILRVSDSVEYFGQLAQSTEEGTTILAEGLESPCDDDLYVVSYEQAGQWQVFVGEISADNGIVETPQGLFLHSVMLRPSPLLQAAL